MASENFTVPGGVQPREEGLAELRARLVEIRELLVKLLHRHGDERAGAEYSALLTSDEKKLPLTAVVGQFWGKTVTRDKESIEVHAQILRLFATLGFNGVVLETTVSRGKWMTSNEAVDRFKQATGW